MGILSISLAEALKSYVDQQVANRGYGSSDEYMCELIRREQSRICLRDQLLAGAASPVAGTVDDNYYARLRQRTT